MSDAGEPEGAVFGPATQAWLDAAFASPTQAQLDTWTQVATGRHVLTVAPTGSGKTLAAFLSAIDRLLHEPLPPRRDRCRVLYLSPLKALGVDVERNLRAPLIGIKHTAERLGVSLPELTVGVRTGDTPAQERRRLVTTPPDILITTPESLFLMLTSQARESLRHIETVIVDEVHAVAGTKRGSHLALTLERLDALLPRPAQRIGLSATVRPIADVAAFLGGTAPVEVVAPPSQKRWDLRVEVPVEDMTQLSVPEGSDDTRAGSIWPHLENRLRELILSHRSTIVFVNSRRLAERLTARLNAPGFETPPTAAPQPPDTPGFETPPTAAPQPPDTPGFETPPTAAPQPPQAQTPPAQMAGQSGSARPATQVLARAHHGSVSKETRAQIEDDLKSGRLPCVIATSSLELGIDMGAVDLVVQVESPPSISSALQRVGRAGHQVGAVSRGVTLPTHRSDLLPAAVSLTGMREGRLEALHVPRHPLDVLAQQIVAMTALDAWDVEALFATIRRASPYSQLPRSAFDATLDLLSGRYPSDEFAELRPRIVWDRVTGAITGRPGAQRLAVTSGGTIPDRGLFGVFIVGTAREGRSPGRRVGELDEEMVYESRVGDVFALGASSWRIEDITHDRVLVTPAPGVPARLPFWTGDAQGRPAELGAEIGQAARELTASTLDSAVARLVDIGLDVQAANNLATYLQEQVTATGRVPSDTALIVERFRDELGDWRMVVHSPYGTPVHAPWALAINARLRERYGVDGQAIASDDGIVIRIPDTDEEPPGGELIVFEADEIADLVTQEISGSALFASRFRECAARALLLPRRDPGRRSPLWQQRQRSAQLLEVAAKYPSFPIILEAVRECLQDVYDVPGLTTLLGRIASRGVTVTDLETPQPSPFARSLMFGYVASFMYEGDSPIAERRAAALTLDQGLLAELLGRAELRELLDPDVLAELEAQLQWLAPDRRATSAEGVADLLRKVGPLTPAQLAARCADGEAVSQWVAALAEQRRVVRTRLAGADVWAVVEDGARLRDALGVPVPPGTPAQLTEPVADPLGDLVSRFARTHGPFLTDDVAEALGIGSAVARGALERLRAEGRLVEGEFRPAGISSEWCDAGVLRTLRRRSLARLRNEIEPVRPVALARFELSWQGISLTRGRPRGVEGVLQVVDQLAGAVVPASAWESLILPARIEDYQPALLDELTATGDVVWAGHGALPSSDGWVSLHLADRAAATLPEPQPFEHSDLHDAILAALAGGGAWFSRQLAQAADHPDDSTFAEALWDLVWASHVTNDTLAPLRGRLAAGGTSHKIARRPGRGRVAGGRVGPPRLASAAGRWAALPAVDGDHTRRTHALAETLLARHGVVTRGAVVAEQAPGGFAAIYQVLSRFEESGRCRRGYFVEGLGAAQFGTAGAVDRLRTFSKDPEAFAAVALAATDPANPYGAALPWPPTEGHRPGRKAGAIVVLVDGALVLYVERGGRTLLSFTDDEQQLSAATGCLSEAGRRGVLGRLTVERADGAELLGSASVLRTALEEAGFVSTPRGLRLRG